MNMETFQRFYDCWLEEESRILESIRQALEFEKSDPEISGLVSDCHVHYVKYADAKIRAAQEDVGYVVAGMWKTPLEAGFLWMGGWRPTTAIVLAYSLMGLQTEQDLKKLLEGIAVPSMAALSSKQLARLNTMQQKTKEAEDDISTRLAVLQMLVADEHMTKATSSDPPPSETNDLSDVFLALEPKLTGLRDLLIEAELLRCDTLECMISLLTPVQGAQYCVAALEMATAVRKLGDHEREMCARVVAPVGNLMELASHGRFPMIQEALRMGADPTEADYEGRTALHVAASKGHTDVVALLVQEGADVNRRDDSGTTPLLDALKGGHDAAAKILRDSGAEANLQEPGIELCKAVAAGNIEYVEKLVKHGVDPNSSDYFHSTPLHIVAVEGPPEAAEFLIQEGADVLAKNRLGLTPVDEARQTGNEATLKILEEELARRHELDEVGSIDSEPESLSGSVMDVEHP